MIEKEKRPSELQEWDIMGFSVSEGAYIEVRLTDRQIFEGVLKRVHQSDGGGVLFILDTGVAFYHHRVFEVLAIRSITTHNMIEGKRRKTKK